MPVRDEIQYSTPGEPRRLEARFDSLEVFAHEYVQNISKGGVFIESDAPFELRELVIVEIVLPQESERVALDGEIVSVRPAGLAGAPPGVAVQLLTPASALRSRLGPLAARAGTVAPEPIVEQRAVPRTPTRVAARVNRGVPPSHTLDLSTRGALLETPEPPPIGDTVEVAIQHPVSGTEVSIESTVVRHHASDGEITGVGVRFETQVSEQPGVERFVEEVQAAAHARSLGAIRGPIDQLGLASLLQMFGASAKQGTLRVVRDGVTGSVAFDAGVLRHARVGELGGAKALARLLGWRAGSFEFHAHLEPGSPEDPAAALDAAIFEAVHHNDELARAALPTSVVEAPLRLDRKRLSAEPGPLEKVEEAVVDLVGAGFPLARVLDVIPVADAEIHLAVRALLERGVLVSDAKIPR